MVLIVGSWLWSDMAIKGINSNRAVQGVWKGLMMIYFKLLTND